MQDFYGKHAIPADSFAWCALLAICQPEEVDYNEILLRPTSQELRGRPTPRHIGLRAGRT